MSDYAVEIPLLGWLNGPATKHPLGSQVLGYSAGLQLHRVVAQVVSNYFPESWLLFASTDTQQYIDAMVGEIAGSLAAYFAGTTLPGGFGEGMRFACIKGISETALDLASIAANSERDPQTGKLNSKFAQFLQDALRILGNSLVGVKLTEGTSLSAGYAEG